jgi:hypothetical protein
LHSRLGAAVDPDQVLRVLVEEANEKNADALYWIEPLFRFGRETLLPAVERELANAELQPRILCRTVTTTKGPKTGMFFTLNFDRLSTRQLFAASLARLSMAERLDELHQCPECKKHFVGEYRAVWCSPACGNRHRVKKSLKAKRKRVKAAKLAAAAQRGAAS